MKGLYGFRFLRAEVRDTSSHHGGGHHGGGGIHVHAPEPAPAAPAGMPMPEKPDVKPEEKKSGGGPGFVTATGGWVVMAAKFRWS